MIVFHSDLDNTLIYSYKREIGTDKNCVEIYQGREISFMTEKSFRLIKEATKKVLFVPTTTRTVEQYERIDLGTGMLEYALTCNGGVLLVNGREDEAWYKESLELVSSARLELEKGEKYLEEDVDRSFEVRNIKNLFLFTKSDKPEETIKRLKEALDTERVDVFQNGVKVYVVPKELNKGKALQRFRKKVQADLVFAAGDSGFDVSMLEAADMGMAPEELLLEYPMKKEVIGVGRGELLSERVLEYVLNLEI